MNIYIYMRNLQFELKHEEKDHFKGTFYDFIWKKKKFTFNEIVVVTQSLFSTLSFNSSYFVTIS